jgi:NADH kinase
LSTPTGSTAYSLSASGPLIHPSHPSILLTPICPRSLSFRPLILPPTSTVDVHVSSDARGGVELSVDGRQGRLLMPGEGVRVGAAPLGWEVPCISRPARRGKGVLASVSEDLVRSAVLKDGLQDAGEEEAGGGWVEDLNGLLGFNKGFRGRYIDHEEE